MSRSRAINSQTEQIAAAHKAMSPAVTLRLATDDDREFLFRLYASTRAEEKALAGWGNEQWEGFLRMQFKLQHAWYMQNYLHSSFGVVIFAGTLAGRFYVDRTPGEIRIIDISLLPEYRGRGIGEGLMRDVLREGDERCVPVSLHVESNNPAMALYRRLGFQEEHFTGVFYFMKRRPGQPFLAPNGITSHRRGEG